MPQDSTKNVESNSEAIQSSQENAGKANNRSSSYSSQIYPRSLLKQLNEQRLSGEFCDVELVADGIRINAHKSILSASSPYFRAMFSAGLREQEQKSVEMHLLSGPIFKSLVDFIYSGNIEITSNNVQDLLVAADMLQLAEVIDLSTSFLEREIDVSNALGIYTFSDGRPYGNLKESAEKFINLNFVRISHEDEFMMLPKEMLEYFLASEFLRVDSEHQVFFAALRWINYNVAVRRCFIFELLKHIRLPLLAISHIECAIHNCLDISLKVALRSIRKDLMTKKGSLVRLSVRPRLCAKKDIFVIGGSRREPLSSWTRCPDCLTFKSVMRFDTFRKEWNSAAPMRLGRVLPGVAALDGHIYVIGGEEDCQILANGERYDPLEDAWTPIASMVVPRCEFGLCALDGELYALGGWVGEDLGQSIEHYDPRLDEWSLVSNLPEPLISMGVVSYEGLIYIVGGCTHQKRHVQDFISFNPVTKEWNPLPNMLERRSQMGVAILDGYLYAVGGMNRRNQVLNTAERYSFEENKWYPVASLIVGRTCPAVAAADGLLYVMGGLQIQEVNFWRAQITISSVECYDPLSNTWKECIALPESRGEAGAVVV